MARSRLTDLTTIAVLLAMLGTAQAQTATPAQPAQSAVNKITGAAADARWEEEHAYTLGVQAYVQLFPWLYNSLLRWRWATIGLPNMSTPTVQANALSHQRQLIDASYRDGGRPNNDTLYSVGFIDLSREPVIVKVPDMGTRYYSFQLVNFDADNFDYIGSRATGNRAGTYALVGPDWKGELPAGVKPLAAAQTPWIIMLVRILVNGEADAAVVHKLQDQISLMPLSQYLDPSKPGFTPYQPQPPIARTADPLADWKNINRALLENPQPAREAQIARMFTQIGIGSGLDIEKTSPAVKRGLIRARDTGAMLVSSGPAFNVGKTAVNGWGITTPTWGRLGAEGQYLARASKSLGGWVAHDREETIYPATLKDANGEPLLDTRRYQLHFSKEQIPPANAFWSLTLYGPDMNFVANPISRYALGDRSQQLKYGTDGSLTIYLQKAAPGGDQASNWLPTGGGNFNLVIRTYLPKQPVLDGSWQPPAVQRVE